MGVLLARVVAVVAFALGARRCSLVLALRFWRSHGDVWRRAASRCVGHDVVARVVGLQRIRRTWSRRAIKCDGGVTHDYLGAGACLGRGGLGCDCGILRCAGDKFE